jgi:hypothetical protein
VQDPTENPPRWARRLLARFAALRPRTHQLQSAPGPVILGGWRTAALIVIAVLVAAASAVSFAESYRGLYDWAREHGLSGGWARIWPLQVDVFIAVGELALFVALIDGWRRRDRGGAWAVTIIGLAVSVAGNIGHIASHSLAARATAAVPPLAAAAALAVGLGVLKRVVAARSARQASARPDRRSARVPDGKTAAARLALAATVEASNPLSVRQLAERFGLTRTEAGNLHRELVPSPSLNGNGPDA